MLIKNGGDLIRHFLSQEIHQSYFVVFVAAGIIVGVILGLVLRINYFVSPVWIVFVIILLVIAYIKPKIAFSVIALIAGMMVAFVRVSNELVDTKKIEGLVGGEITVTGRVNGDPELDEGNLKFKLADLQFDENGEQTVRGSLFVTMKGNEIERDDVLTLKGKLLGGFGVYAGYLYMPIVEKWTKPVPGNLMVRIRNWFAERIMGAMPEREADLGISYLLGMKTYLPNDLAEEMRTVGLVHMVVASGAHLSIIVELVKRILKKISRLLSLILSLLLIVLFMSMIGWTPSILRAGMMASLTLIAWYFGRKIQPWRVILIVMAITLMMEPMFMVNVGWLMSFASYIGIMILGPMVTKYFYGARKPNAIGGMIITTLSATIMTLPITLYYYGSVSLINVVANVLILPTLPWAMGLVFLVGMVAEIPVIAGVASFIATKLLDYHIGMVDVFSKMREFLVEIPQYLWQVFLIYGVVMILMLCSWRCRTGGGELP